MPWSSDHIKWLIDTGKRIVTSDGKPVPIWELKHKNDERILSAWAKHFRNHYCRDTEIDDLIDGTIFAKNPYPRTEYLTTIKFPDAKLPPGPSVRSGDFGEILIADYVEYVLNFWVPRTRFCDRINRNDPSKGVDVIGIKFFQPGAVSPNDALLLFEAKCKLTGDTTNRLQDAIDDSCKDYSLRKAESLNAVRQWFLARQQKALADKIKRFQNEEDLPYKELSGAAALFSSPIDATVLSGTNTQQHPNEAQLSLLVIYGENMMNLVHALYRRAADEA